MINIKTNGKLYIAGEYQVLQSGGIALVYGIDKYIELNINDSNEYSYQNGDGILHRFLYKDNELSFNDTNNNILVQKSFKMIFEYLEYLNVEIKPFKINILTELESTKGEKYGFGSSSAIISAIIKIVGKYFGIDLDDMLLFKLSVLAQKEADELSSGGDLAASIYGTTVFYKRYNIKWLNKQKSFKKLVSKKWPKLKIIPFKTKMNFAAIWTKKSYKTENIELVISKKQLKQSRMIVNNMYSNFILNNYLEIKTNIKQYQLWLEEILEGENLITPEISKSLKILNKYFLAGKVSGAGGGDSVIFLYPEGYDFKELAEELTKNNLELIMLKEEL